MHIFILCHNEQTLIEQTLIHYRTNFPTSSIIIFDNDSTDHSVSIALKYKCKVFTWNSHCIDDEKFIRIKNNCWKMIPDNEWVIMIDMDEWLCITESELMEEDAAGTTLLNVEGCNMIGNSEKVDLSDINLHEIRQGVRNWKWESKRLCFKKGPIKEMNYHHGAHECSPVGNIVYSQKTYINKHMEYLGLPFIIDKFKKRHRRVNHAFFHKPTHYTEDETDIRQRYATFVKDSTVLP